MMFNGEYKFCFVLLLLIYSTLGCFVALIGPRTVPHVPGTTLNVLLTTTNCAGEVATITLKTLGEDVTDKQNLMCNFEQKRVSLKLSKFQHNYTLTLEIKKQDYVQYVHIFTTSKRYSTIIQTDKLLYKPNELVNFRVVALKHGATSDQYKNISAEIINPLGEVLTAISINRNKTLESHSLVSNFQISENTIVGSWKIRAMVDREANSASEQTFEVKEVVAPFFDVIVESQTIVNPEIKTIALRVFGRYTFGTLVKGKVNVDLKVFDQSNPEAVHSQVSKTSEVDGVAELTFDIRNDLNIPTLTRPFEPEFNVTFEDILTGQQIQKTVWVSIHQTEDFVIQLEKDRKFFKFGFPFKVRAIVKDSEGFRVTNRNNPVNFLTTFHTKPLTSCGELKFDSETFMESHEDVYLENGIAEFNLDVPNGATHISVKAQYFNSEASFDIKVLKSKTNEYLEIQKLKSKITIGEMVDVQVEANADIKINVFSAVIGSLGIISHQNHDAPNAKRFKFQIKVTQHMMPSSTLLVYYISTTSGVVYDYINLETEGFGQSNVLQIEISKPVKPGELVNIDITSMPNSRVFLFATDMSEKYLQSHKSFEKHKTSAEVANLAFILTNIGETAQKCIQKRSVDESFGVKDIEYEEEDSEEDDEFDGFSIDDMFDSKNGRANQNLSHMQRASANTWIFQNIQVKESGKASFKYSIPESMPTFALSGFSIHPEHGLAFASPQEIVISEEASEEFFINVHLPYSIRWGEVLKVTVTVFNYISCVRKSITTDVTLHNEEKKFEFVEEVLSNSTRCFKSLKLDLQSVHIEQLLVDSQSGSSNFFLIRALKTGNIKLSFLAQSGEKSQIIEKTLLVESEQITETRSFARLIDLRAKTSEHFDYTFHIPKKAIWSSIIIEATITGGLFKPTLDNYKRTFRKPDGSSGERIKSWILIFSTVEYLKVVGKKPEPSQGNLEMFASEGFKQTLRLQNPDGSFSLHRESDDKSVWLTAYVVKFLSKYAQTQTNSDLNLKSITNAINFIKTRQNADGSFGDTSQSYSYIGTTGTQQNVALAAFLVIAVLESGKRPEDEAFVQKCLSFIHSQVFKLNDNLDFAISAYAFALHNDELAHKFLENLLADAVVRNDEMWWSRNPTSIDVSKKKLSIDVEIAAYAIMAFVTVNRAVEALPVVKWLMKQQKSNSEFYSTTDTALAIQALTMIGSKFYTSHVGMKIKLEYERERKQTFEINSANVMELQNKVLEPDTRTVKLTATGSGLALFYINTRFNVHMASPQERFKLTVHQFESKRSSKSKAALSTQTVLNLRICASFIPLHGQTRTGLTLIELHFPSGYVFDSAKTEKAKSQIARRIETQKQNSVVVLTLDTVGTEPICLEVVAVRHYAVAELKPSVVKIYESYHYNQYHRASTFYTTTGQQMCEF